MWVHGVKHSLLFVCVDAKVTDMDEECIGTMAWYYRRTEKEIEEKVLKVWLYNQEARVIWKFATFCVEN